ncbi:hypothetical protein M408DRAFT_12333 [Serendipita vermifera MAFF 305830]|uniref:Uncharacterized protein n=1 Tax=Serendipita vermifera MAFF 305830 TaxID=933852 RepID=A0A0C3ARL7_SERVB|nr:hypothetical protein M408DRAFT_12333 [Serendipita vermifera MAFF 305830]
MPDSSSSHVYSSGGDGGGNYESSGDSSGGDGGGVVNYSLAADEFGSSPGGRGSTKSPHWHAGAKPPVTVLVALELSIGVIPDSRTLEGCGGRLHAIEGVEILYMPASGTLSSKIGLL